MLPVQAPPQSLTTALNLAPDAWDVIIVGDGSGSKWGYPGGWAAVVFDKRTGLRKTLYGAVSDTTINICELLPYLHAMQWYVRGPGREQKTLNSDKPFARPTRVHVVTDCAIIANQGNRTMARDVNGAFWAGMDHFSRLNYQITYHWFPRDQFVSNRLCDSLSKDMRHLITSIEERLDVVTVPDAYADEQPVPSA